MKVNEVQNQVEEGLFDLNLAVIPCKEKKKKKKKTKKKKVTRGCSLHLKAAVPTQEEQEEYVDAGKIYELLRKRDQMLRGKPMVAGEDGKGSHLIHLLLLSATAINDNNIESAVENLQQLYQHASVSGNSVQRVAGYLADGLCARLLTKKSPFYDIIAKDPSREEEFLAFTQLYKASPYYQFAHFTANQEIIEAFEAEKNRALHVIDFDISYGFQWPSLMQSLSEKAGNGNGNGVSLRITGFGRSFEELAETETRLVNFASSCSNLIFEFEGVVQSGSEPNGGIGLQQHKNRNKNETVAVNLVFHLHTLADSTHISNTLKSVYSYNPSIVILVEKESSQTFTSFLSRFMESLHYFAAMFDSLDDCLSAESAERLCIEKNHLGVEIKRMLNYETDEKNCGQRLATWGRRMEKNGFVANKLSSRSVTQAKLLLKIRCHSCPFNGGEDSGFRVVVKEEGRALSLGWQDKFLITASAWNIGNVHPSISIN